MKNFDGLMAPVFIADYLAKKKIFFFFKKKNWNKGFELKLNRGVTLTLSFLKI